MFALIVRYTVPEERVAPHRDPHVAWVGRHLEAGRLVVTARGVPPVGGLLLATGDRAAVDAMLAEDPFVTAGVAEYEVLELEVRRTAPGLEGLIGA